MTARVTQQVVTTGFTTNPDGRVTAMAIEIIRSVASTGLGAGNVAPVVIVVAS